MQTKLKKCKKNNYTNVVTLFVFLQPTPTSKFIQGYAGAVTSAVSIAVSGFKINTVRLVE